MKINKNIARSWQSKTISTPAGYDLHVEFPDGVYRIYAHRNTREELENITDEEITTRLEKWQKRQNRISEIFAEADKQYPKKEISANEYTDRIEMIIQNKNGKLFRKYEVRI